MCKVVMIVSAFRGLLEELKKLIMLKCLEELAHITLLLDVHGDPVFLSIRWKDGLADFPPHCRLKENEIITKRASDFLRRKKF